MAPMEGVTDSIYRKAFKEYYGGVDKYFTPFLSPNDTFKFTTRELREVDPSTNDVSDTIPQLLTNKSEHFIWACEQLSAMGYREINFNLGCPSGTVVAKKKGSGFLYYPEELDSFFYEIFDGLQKKQLDVSISIKTRLGKNDSDEFYEILDIYNKYSFSELIIHPRIQSDFYKAPVKAEYFDYSTKNSKIPLIFNGELNTIEDINNCYEKYPGIKGIMLGRGLISNPSMISTTDSKFDLSKFISFHNSLLNGYENIMSGDKPVLHRMKEFWGYWEKQFPNSEKQIKKIRKSNKLVEYKSHFDVITNSNLI